MATIKSLRVTCDTKLLLPLDQLYELQGDLKEMTKERYEKFRRLVEKKGIWFAMHVWKEVVQVHSKSEAKRVAALKKKTAEGSTVVKWWIVDGHGRRRLFSRLRKEGYSIPPLPCVEIQASSMKEAKEAVLAASSSFQRVTGQGLYEFIEAGGFEPAVLDDYEVADIDTPDFVDEFYGNPKGDDGGSDADLYTKKIQAPIYEPKSAKPPPIADLVDFTKAEQLLARIDGAKLPDDVKNFLRAAAVRHNVFRYDQIAEFYSHAPKDVQALMEESALVIIDFEKAIENGFVVLSEAIAGAYKDA